jgi:hypothetical protein
MSRREAILDPTGQVTTFTKSYFGTPVEEDRAQEIAQSCDAVIAGVGD